MRGRMDRAPSVAAGSRRRTFRASAELRDGSEREVVFEQVRRDDHPTFSDAMRIYTGSIPYDEQRTELELRIRVRKGETELFVGRVGMEVVFMALLWPLEGTELVLLDYMATHESFRSKGIGSAFLSDIVPQLQRQSRSLLIEVDHPSYGHDRLTRQRRLEFYRRNGAKEIAPMFYALPPLLGGYRHKPMLLLLLPPTPDMTISGRVVYYAVRQLYRQLYGRGTGDETLRMIEESIPTALNLI